MSTVQPLSLRDCVDCGKPFQGTQQKCVGCRAVKRVCACGRSFRGRGLKCWKCQRSNRVCACGNTFQGKTLECLACRAAERVCACGNTFRGEVLKCPACRTVERVCACGKAFKGASVKCHVCTAADRVCACGRAFKGNTAKCRACRSADRVCACGNLFRGTETKCPACRTAPRRCACGADFRGRGLKCRACVRAAVGAKEWAAQQKARRAARRERKRAAAVEGPVSPAVYAAIRAEGECVYCGGPSEVVEHITPLARGGLEHPDNLVPACEPCNSNKATKLLREWRPDRVAYGVRVSLKVAAAYARQLMDADRADLTYTTRKGPMTNQAPPSETKFCVNGCTEPHDPGSVFPRCATVLPEPRDPSPKRCQSFCVSVEKAQKEANPGLHISMGDGAAMTCINCGHPVCVSCQTAPVGSFAALCDGPSC